MKSAFTMFTTRELLDQAFRKVMGRSMLYPYERDLLRHLFKPMWFMDAMIQYIQKRWLFSASGHPEDTCSEVLNWMGELDLFPGDVSTQVEVAFGNVLFEAASLQSEAQRSARAN